MMCRTQPEDLVVDNLILAKSKKTVAIECGVVLGVGVLDVDVGGLR
jgi:hypothetical protein